MVAASTIEVRTIHDRRARLRRLGERAALWFSILVIVSPAILVFLWMLSLAFKNEIDNMSYPPALWPSEPTLGNFTSTFERSPFGLYTVNSLIVSGTATILALIVGVPAGYGVAKSKMQGLAAFVLISRMTPALSFLIPLFILFKSIGLTGTLGALIITHLVITVPIVVWIMIGFFEDLHPDLEEAALVDGCDILGAFLYINMPLARPGIVVSGILAFIFSWNNFIFGVVLAGRETRTLPVAVYNSLTYEQVSWGPLAAAALIVTLPVLLLTVFFQKYIVTGLAAGGVKG